MHRLVLILRVLFGHTCSFYTSKSQTSCSSFTPRITVAGLKVLDYQSLSLHIYVHRYMCVSLLPCCFIFQAFIFMSFLVAHYREVQIQQGPQ